MEAARERAEQLGYRVILMGWGTGSTDDKIKEEVNREVEKIWKIVTRHTRKATISRLPALHGWH